MVATQNGDKQIFHNLSLIFFFSDQESGNFNFSKQTEFVQLIYTSNLQDFFCEMVTVNKQSWWKSAATSKNNFFNFSLTLEKMNFS